VFMFVCFLFFFNWLSNVYAYMLISVLPLEIQLSSEEGLGFILCLSPARTVISGNTDISI
jgi:hypothetical protein